MDCYDPSTGEVIAQAPQCTVGRGGRGRGSGRRPPSRPGPTPRPSKRVQVLFRMKALLDKHLDELTYLVAQENGKVWDEAMGDVLKVTEVVEFACGIPHLMKGPALMNCTAGYDTTQYMEPLGVFAGIAPWNFPAMIPMGWMAPLCIATGNTMVLKAASFTPQTSMRIAELWQEAGLPKGVLNVVTCSRNEAEILLQAPGRQGRLASSAPPRWAGTSTPPRPRHGKRVQALTEAKNHALVLRDAALERTARGIINSACGCAGERCMALPVVVAEEAIADQLVAIAGAADAGAEDRPGLRQDEPAGAAGERGTPPVGDQVDREGRRGRRRSWCWTAAGSTVPGYEKGFYLGPTLFDHVQPGMTLGDREIFGPVLCIKRVKDFEEGLALMNASEFANGSVIYTQSGYYAREFAKRTHGGMVGINVGIPVPLGIFGFTGHKNSFFGDLHAMGTDGVRFFTELKSVTAHWFSEEEAREAKVLNPGTA